MIEVIKIQGVASYSAATPQLIDGLKRINCFYGLNGSGKSTIAKYLQAPSELDYSSCSIKPDLRERVFVYNQKFIKDNFWDSKDQPGVFTVNEGNVEAEKAIETAESKIEEIKGLQLELQEKADRLKKQKLQEQTDLENQVWSEKEKFVKTPLEFCLEGKLRKNLFLEAVKKADIANDEVTLESLKEQAKELEKPDIKPKTTVPTVGFDGNSIELDTISSEVIVGSSSSYLSALIDRVGHSDWVSEGLVHYENSEGVCPFCQETPSESFEANLKSLFDETYKQKCINIESNRKSYQEAVNSIQSVLSTEAFNDEYVIESVEFANAKSKLLEVYLNNLALLREKEAKPSKEVTLVSSDGYLAELNRSIDAINEKIHAFNARISSKPQIRATIKKHFWQIHKRTYSAAIDLVDDRLKSLDEELEELRKQYREKSEAIAEQQTVIAEQRKKTSNIETAIQNIRNKLISVGVDDFHIEKVDDAEARYRIVRKSGASLNVYETLSEGEKTLVTFLYFLEVCKGLLKPDSHLGVADKIVVIDDPVSSLSHNFVYEIATLFQKDIVKKAYQQVFLLTHNLFFFHEVMNQSGLKNDEFAQQYSLYRVRKGEVSNIVPIKRNDIRNEYDGYWQIIRDAKADMVCSPTLPNAMRNVLEHFFSFVHKKDKLSEVLGNLGDEHINFRPLLRYISRESHSDMVNLTDFGDIDTGRFLEIFRQVFVRTEYEDHYKSMMK
ncbi:AAA family ATPase [Pseudidiomarina marina]|uniref:AAA family ATPase n=1 Tax=Pseudidiomarina marina TaxID=502366 RepID=UPI00384F3A2F